MGNTTTRTADGRNKVYVTQKPHGTISYFSGAGDDVTTGKVSGGEHLLFDMDSTDVEKTIDLQFIEDVWIKDGYALVENAPLGSCIDILIVHPQIGAVASFGQNIPLLGSGSITLNTDDCGKLEQGLILRVVVKNGTPKVPFKVAGRIELFRKTTFTS